MFKRRTKATTTEQECKVAFKKLKVDSGAEEGFETDTIVVKGVKASAVKQGRVVKRGRASRRRPARR